ncbi:transposase, partial [Borreliella burgdorferi]|nr:transposase [Borreliella burgdorferi]
MTTLNLDLALLTEPFCFFDYISITVEYLDTKNNNETKGDKKEIVGIDMSMKHFLVSSGGEKINHPKYLLKNENKLKKYQRKL